MIEKWLTVIVGLLNILLIAVGLYLAQNLRRQLRVRIVDRRINCYTSLWDLMKVAGPWRIESGFDPISPEERRELYSNMTDWYFDSGNGMLLGRTTREIYLNAKFNLLIKDDGKLRPPTLKEYRSLNLQESVRAPEQEYERWRGRLSMSQLSLLRASMRSDLAVSGHLYRTGSRLSGEERVFLKAAGANLWKAPWRRTFRAWPRRTSQRGFDT